MKSFCSIVKDHNDGLSLVELIVAISVGSIVAAAIASIIVVSVRMYSKETTNVAGQYEIQTTLNQTVNSAESAQWFAVGVDKDSTTDEILNTKYIAFGKLTGAVDALFFEGEIFTDDYDPTSPGRFNIYMNRYSGSSLSIGKENEAGTKIAAAATAIRGQDKYILGRGATKYVVCPDIGSNRFNDDASAGVGYAGFYENPVVFSISIDFAKDSMTGEVTKHAEDKVAFRNRVKRSLYIEGKGYYKPKE